jgi:hypothetical protein
MMTFGWVDRLPHHSWPPQQMVVSGQLQAHKLHNVERAYGIHWTGGWVGPMTGLDAEEKQDISHLWRESNLAIQPVACRYTDVDILPSDRSLKTSWWDAINILVR